MPLKKCPGVRVVGFALVGFGSVAGADADFDVDGPMPLESAAAVKNVAAAEVAGNREATETAQLSGLTAARAPMLARKRLFAGCETTDPH